MQRLLHATLNVSHRGLTSFDTEYSNVVDIFNSSGHSPAPPQTSTPAPPSTSSPPFPPAPLCPDDCGSCCCPGCHAINSTCLSCAAGFYSDTCVNHSQSACKPCPPDHFCPMGASQPLPCADASIAAKQSAQCLSADTTESSAAILSVALACAVTAMTIHAGIFIKRIKKAEPGLRHNILLLWLLLALMLGPFAWYIWRWQQRGKALHASAEELLSDYDGQKHPSHSDNAVL